MIITKKRLVELVRKYQTRFSLRGYSKLKKQELIDFIKTKNYKVYYNESKKTHELHPIKDPSRNPKLK